VGLTVLVVGSGGREHSLVWKIAQSPLVDRIFAAPGNPGMAKNAELVPIPVDEISRIVDFAVKQKVDLTVVGPEMPLAAGITDDLVGHGLLVCGPSRAAAQLEGSKVFTKNILAKYGIPTADFRVFDSFDDAEQYVLTHRLPVVIKADGLAAGKGVSVAGTYEEAVGFLRDVMEKRIFGAAGERVVVEECLTGEEASYIVFTDGEKIVPLPSSQDHKRIGDGDSGPKGCLSGASSTAG
jgi:phosphoribosylamine--glycine ligase